MAGLPGNKAWLGLAKQSGKGTPATTLSDRYFFSGGNIEPTREIAQLSETDSERHEGDSYVERTGAEGTPEVYARDAGMHHLLEGVLGAIATSGAGPNYTHTLTPASSLPYYTFARGIADTLWQQFDDMKFNEVTISAEAGQPLTVAANVIGRSATRLTAEGPGVLPAVHQGQNTVYNYNEVAVTFAGGATSLISSFDLTISNNLNVQQTDDSVPYDVADGQRQITLGFDMIFETLDEYNRFHTGTTTGTAQTTTIANTAANFTFTKGANNSLEFDFPYLNVEEYPVEPDASGDPIVVPVRARVPRGAAPIVEAVVKNQVAT